MSAFDPKRTCHPFKRDKLKGTISLGSQAMRRREFTKLVKGTILKWSGLATMFLAGVLSIAMLSTSNSGETKKSRSTLV